MDIAKQIANQWTIRQKEIEMVWWLLNSREMALGNNATAKLQAQITACLLMTPFMPESGRQMGEQLAQKFDFHLERLGQLQQMLAEQLLIRLDAKQVAWLAPRLTAFWAEMTKGYALALRQLSSVKQMTLDEKLITEHQQIMAQLIESRRCFEVLFEKTFSPVLIHKNGRILAINKAVTEQFGYPQEMLIGKQIQRLVHTLTPLSERAKILEYSQAGNEQPYHTQCFKQDGTIVAVEIIPQHVSYQDCSVDMVILRPLDGPFIPLLESDEGNLTPRQQAVLSLMARGLAYKEVAERLHITLPTVHYHRREIFKKLQVDTRVQAVAWVWGKNDLPKKSK